MILRETQRNSKQNHSNPPILARTVSRWHIWHSHVWFKLIIATRFSRLGFFHVSLNSQLLRVLNKKNHKKEHNFFIIIEKKEPIVQNGGNDFHAYTVTLPHWVFGLVCSKIPSWWFQICFHVRPYRFGEMIQFDQYFSDGLVQPPTKFFAKNGGAKESRRRTKQSAWRRGHPTGRTAKMGSAGPRSACEGLDVLDVLGAGVSKTLWLSKIHVASWWVMKYWVVVSN